MHLEFAKAHDNTTRRRKGRHGPALGVLPKIWGFPSIFTQWLKLATSNLVHTWVCQDPPENHTQRKSRGSLGLGKLPNICRSPLIFLQRPRCPLSVSGASCCVLCLTNMNRFQYNLVSMSNKHLTKLRIKCPLHLKCVLALPWKILSNRLSRERRMHILLK